MGEKWESSKLEDGRKLQVWVSSGGSGFDTLYYSYKNSNMSQGIDLKVAKQIYHAMSYFYNSGALKQDDMGGEV